MGADTAQGYYIARPLPLDAMVAFWKQGPVAKARVG
jgi:EAL domain-containing protein (putative c-di-GMP-specific phosphodiesterase class I)